MDPGYNLSYNFPLKLSESPAHIICPNCRHEIMTKVSVGCSTKQHIICLLMCLTGVLFLCSCVPYLCSNCSNYRHTCPQCKMHIGTYNSP